MQATPISHTLAQETQMQDASWWIETAQSLLTTWGPKILALVATLVIGWLIARFLTAVTRRLMTRAKVDPILAGWERSDAPPLAFYEPGSWGPAEADDFLARDGRAWYHGCGEHRDDR